MPNYSGYYPEPVTPFQQRCSAYLAPFIGQNLAQGWTASYYYHQRIDERPPAEVVQLYRHNWTLHVQAALHGNEEYKNPNPYQQLGLSADSVLVSLDVERGCISDAPYSAAEVREFQKSVRNAVQCADVFASLSPAVLYRAGHHVIVEVAEYGASDLLISNIAARLIAYCETVYDIASSATLEFSGLSGYE